MRQNYLKNAVLLTGSSLALRLAGMGFRIWLANRLGSEGLGLYQLILAMYEKILAGATVADLRRAADAAKAATLKPIV